MRRALLAALLLALVAPPVNAQEADDDPAAAEHLVLVRQTPWVVPGGAMGLRLRVDDPPDGAQLRIGVHRPVRNRTEFVRTLDGEGLRGLLSDREATPLADLSVDADGTIAVRIPTADTATEDSALSPQLGTGDDGVYPVVVELLDADDTVVDRLVTHLLRLPAADDTHHPIDAVVTLPLHAPPSHVRPGEVDATALAPLDTTVEALVANPAAPLTIVATPEALAGAVAVDPDAAGRLATAVDGRDVLASTWVRLDPVAWAVAGLQGELEAQRAAGRDAVVAAIGRPPDDTVAVVPAGAGPEGVAAAVADGATAVVVPEDDLEPLGDDFPLTLTRPFRVPSTAEGGTVEALVADAALAAHHERTDDPVLAAHHLLADLAVLALDAPVDQRVAVVALDDDAATDPDFLDAVLGGLTPALPAGVAPLVEPTTIADALADVEPAGAEGEPDPDDPLVREYVDGSGDDRPLVASTAADIAAVRSDLGSYVSVFGPGDQLVAEVEQLVLTAGSATLVAEGRRAILGAGADAVRAAFDGIEPPPQQRVTLTARRGQVQLVFTNTTGRPADVSIQLRGDRLELVGRPDGRLDVRLEEETTRISLDLEARTSGDAPLDLRMTTPDGRIELGQTRITVRTTAFSGVGLVLMGGAGVFLVVWWTRTILRERRAKKLRRRRPAHARVEQ